MTTNVNNERCNNEILTMQVCEFWIIGQDAVVYV